MIRLSIGQIYRAKLLRWLKINMKLKDKENTKKGK